MNEITVSKITTSKNTFLVSEKTKSLMVACVGDSVWTCQCHEFFEGLRLGNAENQCIHIKACKPYVKTVPKNNPQCRCGSNRVKKRGRTRGIQYYQCNACNKSFTDTPHLTQKMDSITPIIACTKCDSTRYTKAGKKRGKQVYRCSICKARFVYSEPGFTRSHYNPEIICNALNMTMSGMSNRKVAEHIHAQYNRNISHNTIISWVSKYTKIIKAYVDTLRPITGNVWSVDEAFINIKNTSGKHVNGRGNWLWSAIDPSTRMLLATRIAKGNRSMSDVINLLTGAKKLANAPRYLVSDSHSSYSSGVRESVPNAAHITTKAIRDGFTNMPIERYHNEIREKLKSCRGLGNPDSAQIFCDLLRIHHNFVRPHMGLGGKTPAETAGIATPDVRDGKYRTLVNSAASVRKIPQRLGSISEQIQIVRLDSGNVIVTPVQWLENDEWRKANELLVGMGFTWMFTSLTRYWIMFGTSPSVTPSAVPAMKSRTPV